MKKDLKAKLVNRKVEKPNAFIGAIVRFVLGIINRRNKVEFSYDYDPETIKTSLLYCFPHTRQG